MCSTDPRSARTKAAILDGFVALLGERRYDAIRIADLVAAAGIARSTFYEHFGGKNDVLLAAMHPVLLALSTAASGRAARSYVRGMMNHLWDRRSTGRLVLGSTTGPIVQRHLAKMIQPHIDRAAPAGTASHIRATGIAAAQIAMLRSWLAGEASCSAEEITERMIDCARLIG